MPDTPTSSDVARLAGVAQSTVSYVLTGKGRISQDTRERVLRAMEALNYQPNAGAQALRTRKSRVIGLMFPIHPDGDHSARMRFLTEVVGACRGRGYDALVVTADEGPSGLRRLAETALCDGLLVMEIKEDDQLAGTTAALRVPTVFVGVPARHDEVVCVARDYGVAGTMCVQRLAAAGYQRAALLVSEDDYLGSLNYHRRFVRGVTTTAQLSGVEVTEYRVGTGLIELYASVQRVVQEEGPHPAIICGPSVDSSDLASALVLQGLQPGRDVSLVGITDLATQAAPPAGVQLSQADLSGSEVARRAVARLLELVEQSPESLAPGAVDLIVPTWIEGDSVLALAGGQA